MTALLALLALAAGPLLIWAGGRRLRRRAVAAGVTSRADVRELATNADAGLGAAGLLLTAAGVLTLAVLAVPA